MSLLAAAPTASQIRNPLEGVLPSLPKVDVETFKKEERVIQAMRDPQLRSLISKDLHTGIVTMALDDKLWTDVMQALDSKEAPIDKAREVVRPFRDAFYWHFKDRSVALAKSVKPAIENAIASLPKDHTDPILFDWGTGDTQVASKIQELFPSVTVKGGDIIPYYKDQPLVPFFLIKNNLVPEVKDQSVSIMTLNYVLHHDEMAHGVFEEAARILKPGGKLIVVELVPTGPTLSDRLLDLERLWFSDMIFCNIWHNSDKIPMPGNYRTVDSWSDLANIYGLSLESKQAIRGTPVIYADQDCGRQVMVFEKPKA